MVSFSQCSLDAVARETPTYVVRGTFVESSEDVEQFEHEWLRRRCRTYTDSFVDYGGEEGKFDVCAHDVSSRRTTASGSECEMQSFESIEEDESMDTEESEADGVFSDRSDQSPSNAVQGMPICLQDA